MNPCDWKTASLLRLRDALLEDIARMSRRGVSPTPLPACVLLIERELDRREIASSAGSLQVVAEEKELVP